MPRMDAAVDSDDRSRPILCPAYQNVIAPAASTITRYSSSALGALLCEVLRFRYDIQDSPARVLKASCAPTNEGSSLRICCNTLWNGAPRRGGAAPFTPGPCCRPSQARGTLSHHGLCTAGDARILCGGGEGGAEPTLLAAQRRTKYVKIQEQKKPPGGGGNQAVSWLSPPGGNFWRLVIAASLTKKTGCTNRASEIRQARRLHRPQYRRTCPGWRSYGTLCGPRRGSRPCRPSHALW